MEKDNEGYEKCELLFQWFESISKAKNCVHVFLASSEQFFVKWISIKLPDKYETFQIVDLPKLKAESYYQKIINDLKIQNCKIDFQNLYQLTGILYILSLCHNKLLKRRFNASYLPMLVLYSRKQQN